MDTVAIAFVRRAHGVKGEVQVDLLTDFPDRIVPKLRLYHEVRHSERRVLTVSRVRPIVDGMILAFEQVADRLEAELLAGGFLSIDETDIHPLPEDTWYIHDLVGCRVEDKKSGADVGEVRNVLLNTAQPVLEVDHPRGLVLVPMTMDILVEVSIPERRIVVDLPEGMLEMNWRDVEDA